jgi:prophage tail gpP-like protein
VSAESINNQAPLELDFVSAQKGSTGNTSTVRTFNSYSFQRSVLTPASPFRFTAPGLSLAARQAIRSGDMVSAYVVDNYGQKQPFATGFIDETDTHIMPTSVEYVLTGRDTLSPLVDNSSVDANNKVIVLKQCQLATLLQQLMLNTRINKLSIVRQNIPTGTFLVQSNPGETKINTLERYMQLANCLIWTNSQGQPVLGKPNMAQVAAGALTLSTSSPKQNNLLEARVRRNVNNAIRIIVSQLQTLDLVDAASFTLTNNDQDMLAISQAPAGRSVYQTFSYGEGTEAVNQLVGLGNQGASYQKLGYQLSLRELAKDNMRILEVEAVVRGHTNEQNVPYDIDQVYSVRIDDDGVLEDMYLHSVTYEMTLEHGPLTRLNLCRLGAIVAQPAILSSST